MTTTTQHNKLTKSKGKMVKPILKKLHSEKNSLDLDRPWEEQQGPGLGVFGSGYDVVGGARSARDVSFNFPDGSPILPIKQPRFHHVRTPSGTSHTSVATAGSNPGGRSSGFVHPFQQTPRTQTPPLTFGSVISLDTAAATATATTAAREYSPTITEDEDDDSNNTSNSNHSNHSSSRSFRNSSDYPRSPLPPTSHPQLPVRAASNSKATGNRHHSLTSKRAASFTDMSAALPLRVNTARAVSNGHPRRSFATGGSSAPASSVSQSDLHLNSAATLDSTTAPASFVSSASVNTGAGAGSSNGSTPLSPLRTSFEGVAFPRLRSRSELYAGDRTEQIREARRKFEERERVKAEKHDREMLRKRERRDNKEAREMERQAAAARKNSGGYERPSLSRRPTPTFGRQSAELAREKHEKHEKALGFKSSNYDNMAGGTTPSFGPAVDDVSFRAARRNTSARRKTQGYWNEFILWLRTRLFRLGRK